MNIPTKVLRSQFINYETYFQHQQLAKRFYKSTRGKKIGKQNSLGETEMCRGSTDLDSVGLEFGEMKKNFKEELIKW